MSTIPALLLAPVLLFLLVHGVRRFRRGERWPALVPAGVVLACEALLLVNAALQLREWEHCDLNPIVEGRDFAGHWALGGKTIVITADGSFSTSDQQQGRWRSLDNYTIAAGARELRAVKSGAALLLLELPGPDCVEAARACADPDTWSPRMLWRRQP